MNIRSILTAAGLTVLLLTVCSVVLGQDEPDLPDGLDEPAAKTQDEPDLPGGLEDANDEPDLPPGLDDGDKQPTTKKSEPVGDKGFLDVMEDLELNGFWEVRGGVRTQADRHEKDASIGETRLQLEWEKAFQGVTFKYSGDFLYDHVDNRLSDVDMVRGTGWFDLRELSARFSPAKWMDVKVGRQILTWGTADLMFLNDLFPKDWRAFFIGRDLEYLKAPADAMKVSFFSDIADLDLVYMPRFNPSRFVSGRRISYFNTMLGRRAGQDALVETDLPNEWFDDSEWAARVSRRLGSYELAAYGYWGYWKTPEGFDIARSRATYPRLSTYGGSLRGPLGRGIANLEAAYYDSRQDRGGDDPFVRNSEIRLMAGYEMDLPEIAPELTLGMQYYVELMQGYGAYLRTLPAGSRADDRDRHVITVRLTKQLLNQNLTLGLFTYYSPTDSDAYMRPNIRYKIDDNWTVEVGGNVFVGKDDHTFFGQFERDSNIYASLRYAF